MISCPDGRVLRNIVTHSSRGKGEHSSIQDNFFYFSRCYPKIYNYLFSKKKNKKIYLSFIYQKSLKVTLKMLNSEIKFL